MLSESVIQQVCLKAHNSAGLAKGASAKLQDEGYPSLTQAAVEPRRNDVTTQLFILPAVKVVAMEGSAVARMVCLENES